MTISRRQHIVDAVLWKNESCTVYFYEWVMDGVYQRTNIVVSTDMPYIFVNTFSGWNVCGQIKCRHICCGLERCGWLIYVMYTI